MKKKSMRLCSINVLFPIWFFYIWPTYIWLVILAVNFIVDSIVLLAAMKWNHCDDKLFIWKKSILKVWGIGFLSDFIGACIILGIMSVLDAAAPGLDTIHFPGTCLLALPGVAVSALAIYFLNRKFSFRSCDADYVQIHNLCLSLAVFSAPYTMLVPLYG